MRFDDRLATVLAQPAATPRDLAVRWRQLVDLVARSGGDADSAFVEKAVALIRSDAPQVDEKLRAAAARAIAGMPVPVSLLSAFAADKLKVAAPVLAGATLSGDDLVLIRDAASEEVRRFLDSLRGTGPVATESRSSPPESRPSTPKPEPTIAAEPIPSISDLVARIERRRSTREAPRLPVTPDAYPPVDVGSPSLFRWECTPSGEIDWIDGAPRGPLVGRTIAVADPDEGVDDCVERAFGVRAPFRDCILEMGEEGALAGQWTISGVPAFAPGDGRFVGYRGIARKGLPEPQPAPPAGEFQPPGDRDDHVALREMIHEIRTPLNAIIGFAEIIDGQYLGPAHSRYRERAADIVANARSLLEAAEDLDFAARLQSARSRPGEGTDFASFFPPFADDLMARAAVRAVQLEMDVQDRSGRCLMEPELIERLFRRFSDAVLSAADPGEYLRLRAQRSYGRLGLSFSRPRATMAASKDELLDPEYGLGTADGALLGLGFSLRLVNGLIGIAGGALEITPDHFTLFVPLKND